MNLESIKEHISILFSGEKAIEQTLQEVCNFLRKEVKHYNWVGFYFKNGAKNELKLAQFSGEPTEHTIIPFGKGICGQVALSNKKFIVPDVSTQNNYISCGFKVKSEIVLPIFVNNENIGQIDIDSHTINPFSEKDEELLEFVCHLVSKKLTYQKAKNK